MLCVVCSLRRPLISAISSSDLASPMRSVRHTAAATASTARRDRVEPGAHCSRCCDCVASSLHRRDWVMPPDAACLSLPSRRCAAVLAAASSALRLPLRLLLPPLCMTRFCRREDQEGQDLHQVQAAIVARQWTPQRASAMLCTVDSDGSTDGDSRGRVLSANSVDCCTAIRIDAAAQSHSRCSTTRDNGCCFTPMLLSLLPSHFARAAPCRALSIPPRHRGRPRLFVARSKQQRR